MLHRLRVHAALPARVLPFVVLAIALPACSKRSAPPSKQGDASTNNAAAKMARSARTNNTRGGTTGGAAAGGLIRRTPSATRAAAMARAKQLCPGATWSGGMITLSACGDTLPDTLAAELKEVGCRRGAEAGVIRCARDLMASLDETLGVHRALRAACPKASLRNGRLMLDRCALRPGPELDAVVRRITSAKEVQVSGVILVWSSVPDDALAKLLSSPAMRRVELFRAQHVALGPRTFAALADREVPLRTLSIQKTGAPAAPLARWLSSRGTHRLITFSARDEPQLTDAVVAALAEGPGCLRVQRVVLDRTGATDAGLRALARPCLKRLRVLHVRGPAITDAGLAPLLTARAAQTDAKFALRVLGLAGTATTDRTLALIAKLPHPLLGLNLRETKITDAGAAKLASALGAKTPKRLCLGNTAIGEKTLAALASAPARPLRTLDLSGTAATDAALTRLLRAPMGAKLSYLHVRDAKGVHGAFLGALTSRPTRTHLLLNPAQLDPKARELLARHNKKLVNGRDALCK